MKKQLLYVQETGWWNASMPTRNSAWTGYVVAGHSCGRSPRVGGAWRHTHTGKVRGTKTTLYTQCNVFVVISLHCLVTSHWTVRAASPPLLGGAWSWNPATALPEAGLLAADCTPGDDDCTCNSWPPVSCSFLSRSGPFSQRRIAWLVVLVAAPLFAYKFFKKQTIWFSDFFPSFCLS